MVNSLQLTLFGSPEVRLHGQAVTGFRSSKAQALLYYLAVTGRPHTRPTLAGLFWGDQPEAAARTSLSKCLSNLRELVGDAVLVDRQTVAFNRNQPCHLDTERFLTGIGQPLTSATIESWQGALALYRGDFLEGFYVRDAPDFEQWVLVQRAHYREAVINGLHALANWHDQQGDLPQAITHTRRLLTLEPWREEAHRQLMTRLARSGQRAAALAQFEICYRVLEEELAVEPDAETIALVEAIRAGEFDKVNMPNHPVTLSPPHPVMPHLPIPPTPLIGRERELTELGELIGSPQCRLITITGPGGIGKTRLALAAAVEYGGKFQQGAVFVPLATLSSAQFLPQAILGALNVALQGTVPLQQQVRNSLYKQEQLLVLDNYEHLLPDVELLLDILSYAPNITLLVTSRERLVLQAEYLSELTGLAYPAWPLPPAQTESLSALGDYAAIQLFLQRVCQIQPRFTPTATEIAAMVQICRKLNGIPLAIELAAARARILSIEQIATRLSDSLNLLTTGSRTTPPRHQTLRATIDWSYNLLTEEERVLLRRLAVFAGGFSLTAVEQVCGPYATSLLDLMTRLVDKSLVVVDQNEGEMLYRLLETIGEYAHEKLLNANEEERLQLNHLNFFTQLAETAFFQLHGSQQQQWLTQLESVHDELRRAIRWAVKQGLRPEAIRLAAALGDFWEMRCYWREGRQALTEVLSLPQTIAANQDSVSITDRWQARALWLAGRFHWRYRDYIGAQANLQASLTFYRQLDDLAGQGDALAILGHVALDQGHDEEARLFFDESLVLRLKIGDKSPIGYALHSLGMAAINQRDYVSAQTILNKSLELFRASGDQMGTSLPLFTLGDVAYLQTNYAEAQRLYKESLTLRREVGDKRGVAAALASIANVCVKLGDHETAQTLYRESLALYSELDNPHGIVRAFAGLARIHKLQGQLHLAATLLSLAESQLLALNNGFDTSEKADQEQALALLRSQLDEEELQLLLGKWG